MPSNIIFLTDRQAAVNQHLLNLFRHILNMYAEKNTLLYLLMTF